MRIRIIYRENLDYTITYTVECRRYVSIKTMPYFRQPNSNAFESIFVYEKKAYRDKNKFKKNSCHRPFVYIFLLFGVVFLTRNV